MEDSTPHIVHVDKFSLSATPVTIAQFNHMCHELEWTPIKCMSNDDDDYPVNNVNWFEAKEFCGWMSEKTNMNVRLPTEAEWEYAASCGGKYSLWSGTDRFVELTNYAWFKDNANYKIHPVAQKKPNDYGLYDMCGNIYEWCEDKYEKDYYNESPPLNPLCQGDDPKVIRGGNWAGIPENLFIADRWYNHVYSKFYIGFRIVVQQLSINKGI